MTRWHVPTTIATVLGLATVLPFASTALAGGGKSGPAAKPAAAPAADGKYASLGDLEAACDEAEAAAHKNIRRTRYEKVVAYLGANGSAQDAETALGTAMDLAEEIEEWAKTVEHADVYLKAYAEGDRKVDALLTKAGALTHLGKPKETKDAYAAAFAAVDVAKVNPNAVIGAYMGYADWLMDENDVEGAKKAYSDLKDAYASHGAADQIARVAEGMAKNLEQIGQEATAFPETAKDLDGKVTSLADFKGKVLLIDFWATWCGPCRAELPNVIKAYEKYHAKGFEVLGVSLDRPGDLEKLKGFIKDKKMPWRQVYYADGNNAVAEAYGVEGIPHTVLVDKEGKVLRVGLRGEALQKKLATLFAK